MADTKKGSKEHSHHQIHGLSRGRPLIINRIWAISLAYLMLQGSIESTQGAAGNQRMHKEKEKERLKFYVLM